MDFCKLYNMKEQLTKTATLIRSKLEEIDFADELNCLAILKRFPFGCCKASALIFLYYQKHYLNVDASNLYLLANGEIDENRSHAWSKVSGIHVDLTGDQFGKKNVMVEELNPWPDIYRGPAEYPFEEEFLTLIDPYKKDIIRICNYIE